MDFRRSIRAARQLLCLVDAHRWRKVKRDGRLQYERCALCGCRRLRDEGVGGGGPVDVDWLVSKDG